MHILKPPSGRNLIRSPPLARVFSGLPGWVYEIQPRISLGHHEPHKHNLPENMHPIYLLVAVP